MNTTGIIGMGLMGSALMRMTGAARAVFDSTFGV
jgi:prephenate dehydrogenase